MKQYRGILILAALALVLGGAYWGVTARQSANDTGLLFTPRRGEHMTAVTLVNHYGTFTFTLDEALWSVESEGTAYRASANKMELLVAALEALPVSRVLEADSPVYGLAEPRASISFTTSLGRTGGFALGAETASHSDVYIQDGESGRVMITSTGATAQFTSPLEAYRTKDVFTVDENNIRSLTYCENGQRIVSVEYGGPQNWSLTYPYEAPARTIELSEVMSRVKKWSVAGYPAEETTQEMGLETPSDWLELTDGDGKTQRFQFGSTDGATATYVRTGSEHEIVKLYTVDLDFSALTPDGLLFVAPLKATVNQIASIAIQTPEEELLFSVEQTAGGQKIMSGGKEVPPEAFSSVFFQYIIMNADGRDPKEVSAPPVATLTTTYTDGATAQLVLLPRDETTYYMVVDGKTDYYMAAENLTQLLYRAHKALADG